MDAEGINPSFPKKPKMDPNAQTTSASAGDEEPAMNSPASDIGDENDDAFDLYNDEDDAYLFADADDNNDDDDGADGDYDYLQAQFDKADLPSGVEASFSLSLTEDSASSSSSKNIEKAVRRPKPTQESLKEFKAFDVVDDFPDHIYKDEYSSGQPAREWTRKVQDEWRILEKDLPETIFARACESRMDLMRAAITGPQGTPYHDGLYIFDIHFPPEYPQLPPLVTYHSHGLRINPNLYNCGKVCLSLLNTWTGSPCERWQPGRSTMLQVLVSIQAFILNDKPYFNEPGYEITYNGPLGEENCIAYSENVLLLSLKTMMNTINNPPSNFEDLVFAHFCVYAVDILAACKAYLDGAPVGSVVKGQFPAEKRITKLRSQILFNIDLAKLMNKLVPIFLDKCNAPKVCEQFLIHL